MANPPLQTPERLSTSAREMLLEQAIHRLEAQRDRLFYALRDLQHRGACFCEVSIGNPMMRGQHTRACEKASEALSEIERQKHQEMDALMDRAAKIANG